MVITLTETRDQVGSDNKRYFLSQGETVESANRNIRKHLCGRQDSVAYNFRGEDLSNFLYGKFARWQDGKDTWKDSESWSVRFSDFTFPRSNRAEIVEISREMFDEILREYPHR